MKYLLSLIILASSLSANALESYSFIDFSGDTNEVKFSSSENRYYLEFSETPPLELNPMPQEFDGLELYETIQFKRNPGDQNAIGNIFGNVRFIIKRNDHPEFTRALTLFREMLEEGLNSEESPVTLDQFCPWTSDAILVLQIADDDEGQPGPKLPFCLKLEN